MRVNEGAVSGSFMVAKQAGSKLPAGVLMMRCDDWVLLYPHLQWCVCAQMAAACWKKISSLRSCPVLAHTV